MSTVIGGAIGGVLLLIMIVLLVLIVVVLYIRRSQIRQKYSVDVEANSKSRDSEYITRKVDNYCVTMVMSHIHALMLASSFAAWETDWKKCSNSKGYDFQIAIDFL